MNIIICQYCMNALISYTIKSTSRILCRSALCHQNSLDPLRHGLQSHRCCDIWHQILTADPSNSEICELRSPWIRLHLSSTPYRGLIELFLKRFLNHFAV